jgi:hypothetical protein
MLVQMPMRWRAVLFTVGVLILSGAIFFVGKVPALHGAANPLGYLVLFIWFTAFLAFVYFGSAWMTAGQAIRPAIARYRRRMGLPMMAYCVILLGSIALLKNSALSGPLLWIVAAAPAGPILWALAVMGLYLKEEDDELERAIHVEAMLWGLGIVLAVATVWGFLSNAKVAPPPPVFLIFALFCAGWGGSQPFIRRRYQ